MDGAIAESYARWRPTAMDGGSDARWAADDHGWRRAMHGQRRWIRRMNGSRIFSLIILVFNSAEHTNCWISIRCLHMIDVPLT